jgi:hypothetical protein
MHKIIATAAIAWLGLTLAVQAQTMNPKLLEPPVGVLPRYATFALGEVNGFPAFALVYRTGQEALPPVCAAHKLLVQADKGTPEIAKTMKQAVISFLAHCDGKIWAAKPVPGQEPRLRSYMPVEQFDAVGIKYIVADARSEVRGHSFMSSSIQFAELPNGSATLARAAQKTAQDDKQRAHHAALQPSYRANALQLQQWFSQHSLHAFVSLTDIARNPFAYEQKTVLTIASFDRANSATEVLLSEPREYYSMLLQNTQAREWKEGGYLVIAQVQGRTAEKSNLAVAKALQHIACKEFDCRDLLLVPDATGALASLFKFGMKPSH